MRIYDSNGRLIVVSAIDDIPVDGNVEIAASSNWAYDHAADISAHHVKYTDAEAIIAAKTVKLDDFTAPDDNTDLDAATNNHGLMSKSDKIKLDGIEAEATKYPDTGEQAFLDADHTKLNGIEASAVALTTVKADADIADAIAKKHTQGTDTTLGTQSQNLDMGSHAIVNVVDPTADQDAATKKYIDDLLVAVGAGDMLKSDYDPNNDKVISLANLDLSIPVLIEDAKILALLGV